MDLNSQQEAPRPLHDIATVAEVKQKILGRYCTILMNKLYPNLPNIDPSKCLVRLGDMIKANERAKQLAAIIVNEVVEQEISVGKNPMAVAASILYICCEKAGNHITQRTVSNAAGISEVTLRNRFKELKRRKIKHV